MLTVFDWSIWTLYLAVFLMLLWLYRNSKKKTTLYKWFLPGFLIKVFGGVLFVLVSVYYYRGDTILYFDGAKTLSNYLIEDPAQYLRLLFAEVNESSEFLSVTSKISYSKTAEEWFMVKILSVFCFFSCNSYLVLTLFMSFIAFWGGWKLFRVFINILPQSGKVIFIIIFLTPSVLFWGTGVLKDTITLALLNYLIFVLYYVLEKKISVFFPVVFSLLSGIIIYNLKSYVLLAFLPSVVLIFYVYFKNSISSRILRLMILPIIFFSFATLGFFTIQKLTEDTVYSSKNIKSHIRGFHSWHTTTGGSSYDLGDVELTFTGIVKKVPASLNVTFFRPYLWEARNLTSLIGAVESTIVLLFFVIVIAKVRLRFFSLLRQNKLLWGLMIYILVFGFAVGFTSYNFGALSRYKMPIISLYIFALYYVYIKRKTAG